MPFLSPGIDVVLVPRRGLMEGDVGVVAVRGVDEAGEGLLEGGVERRARDPGPVGREGGLGVVEQGGPDAGGVAWVLARGEEEVDGGRVLPAGALVEEGLGEGVGREGARRDVEGLRVVAGEEADAARGVDPPGAQAERGGQGLEGGRGQAVGQEGGERGVAWMVEWKARVVVHGEEGLARVVVGARHEHDARELRREADLAEPGQDLVEARVVGRGGEGAVAGVGLVVEGGCGPDPEPGQAGRAGVGGEELELERRPGPGGVAKY